MGTFVFENPSCCPVFFSAARSGRLMARLFIASRKLLSPYSPEAVDHAKQPLRLNLELACNWLISATRMRVGLLCLRVTIGNGVNITFPASQGLTRLSYPHLPTSLPTLDLPAERGERDCKNLVPDPWHLPPSHRWELQQTFSFPAAFQLPMSLSHQATCLPFHLRRRDCGTMCTHEK